ncbi:MAG TPA: alpha/beta hydrolase, partial [Ktedonobacterales bacterium]
YPLLPGIRSRVVVTRRLRQHVYESGSADGEPLLLLHGNVASARFFEELMLALPEYHVVAPDLRGYGASEAKPVDATRGVRDFADDVHALIKALGLHQVHLLGWSLGGNVSMQYVIEHAERVLSLTLLASGSPYGYGGTSGVDGQANYADYAGSGAGLVSPVIRARLQARDFGAASVFSPRAIFRRLYVRPWHYMPRVREDALVEQILLMALGDHHYPGDSLPSRNWPFVTPGAFGPNNAVAPKYLNQRALADVRRKVPILWLRGDQDRVVSDAALTDPGTAGKLRLIPRWPGTAVFPPQPMLAQLRAVLRQYAAHGGEYREVVLANCGHSPHLERPGECVAVLRSFLRRASPAPRTLVDQIAAVVRPAPAPRSQWELPALRAVNDA